jgi:ABC-type amino acid transport substrate-binding protein
VPVKTYRNSLPEIGGEDLSRGRIDVIAARGTLRVGYLADALPFAFSNEQGEIVGFDVEMAHMLAGDMGVDLELVRIDRSDISSLMAAGHVDIVMSGLAITAQRALKWEFSASPMDLTLGLLVADYRRKEFSTLRSMQNIPDLKVGIIQSDTGLRNLLESSLPELDLVSVRSPREFLRGNRPELDAVAYSAEGGSAWTLLYPAYSVVVPKPATLKLSMGYPLPRGELEWTRFVSAWVTVKQKEGTVAALFDHWIKGQGADDLTPRWSVIRDVLHWVD